MKTIMYRLTLLDPVFIPAIEGDPNSAVSYPYIPGSSIRGALVGEYLRDRGLAELKADDQETRALFLAGSTRYLNAYPRGAKGRRALPTPLSWFIEKDKPESIYDFAQAVGQGQVEWKLVRSPERLFVTLDGDRATFFAANRQVNVHTTREPNAGRAIPGEGTVFQYQALAEGEEFVGAIVVDDDASDKILAKLLRRTVWSLGGARNAGYGRVRLTVTDTDLTNWREVDEELEAIEAGKSFVVMLVSDILVRDLRTGQYTTDLKSALEGALNAKLGLVDKGRRSAQRIIEVGGFNRKWGMPFTQAQAIQTGSVFVFTADRDLDIATLHGVEWRGLGERRAEGFGRLIFGWPNQETIYPDEKIEYAIDKEAPELSGLSLTMGEKMLDRLVRRDLSRCLRAAVNNYEIEKPPSNAQLSRFRVIARDALDANDNQGIERLRTLLKGIKDRRTSRDQFDQARIRRSDTTTGSRLSAWLEARLEDPNGIWKHLDNSILVRYELGDNLKRQAQGNVELSREYTIRLIDGVLAKAAQMRRQKEG